MANCRTAIRSIAIIAWLAAVTPLHAQTTPHISSLQSGSSGPTSPTNGAAITAGTPGGSFFLFINGNFNPDANVESVTWTSSGVTAPLTVFSSSTTQVVASVPASLYSSPGSAIVTVTETLVDTGVPVAGITSNGLTFAVNPAMANVASIPSGFVGVAYSQAFFTGGTGPFTVVFPPGSPPPPGLNSAAGAGNPLAGTPALVGLFAIAPIITDSWGNIFTPSESITIATRLLILTTGLPSGTVGTGYGGALSASGGTAPYLWSVTGLPAGLAASANTISGTPSQSGVFTVSVTLMDSGGQTARALLPLTINPAPSPPVQIVTASVPNGTVGVAYSVSIGASGGNGGPYSFTVTGSFPPGMRVSNTGLLQGVPTTPGTFIFNVTAADSTGNSSASTPFSIAIAPAPLSITTGALSSVQVGSSIGITFAATGGVPPLAFSLSGSAPPGASFSSSGTLSGTASTAGSYSFTIAVTDSVRATASKVFTVVVTAAPLTIATATLPNAKVGTAYAGQFAAAGGTPPYSWSGSAGDGLSVSASGALSGTPAAAGTYPVSVTVADSAGVKTSGNYSVTVNTSSLAITTSGLPNGALTSAYSASLSATGGTPPYTWSASGLPAGIAASSNGSLSGTPTSPGAFTVSVTVKDSAGVSVSANLGLTILPAPLKITTTGITPPALGTSFSLGFGATGGTPPYTWSATGLPAGVTITSTGTLSGTPTALGNSAITVNVTDSNGQKASETVNLTVILPAAPAVVFTGLPATANPATQSTTPVSFNVSYPVDVTLNLTLTFAPLAGAGDPNIQFSTGGRTASVTIKAGSTASTSSIGVQTGTVAGTITITSQLLAAGQDITPVPAPTKTIVIAPAAPSITSVTAPRNSTGFTVTIVGFDTTRAVTQGMFTFTAAAGSTLQTTSATIPAASLFSSWYQSSASAAYGSQFSFTIPFAVTGNVQSILSVTVTLVNPTGTSTAVTANLQ